MFQARDERLRSEVGGASMAVVLGMMVLSLAACDDDDHGVGPVTVPNVAGVWIGQYNVTRCTLSEPGAFCDEAFYPGASLIFEMELNQSRAAVSGPAFLGEFEGEVSGSVDEVGTVTLSGTIGSGQDLRADILDWDTFLEGDSLVGEWRFRVRDNVGAGLGTATVTADILLVDPAVVPTFYDCPVQEELRGSDELLGALSLRDCQLDDFSYFDVYAVNVLAGDELLISMASNVFEPFLFISDLDEVGIDFDGEPGRTEVAVDIVADFAETWLIVANSLAPDVTGDYLLTVDRLAVSAAPNTAGPAPTAAAPERIPMEIRKVKASLLPADIFGARAIASESPQASIRQRLMQPGGLNRR